MPATVSPDLIELAKGGDHHAFRKIVETHQGFAYAVAFKFVGNRNEAEDITQEAFIKLWKNIGKYRPEIKLSTWLYKIIMNLCLDFLKSAQRKQQLKTEDVESNTFIVDQASHEQKLDDTEILEVIVELAKQLTPKQQSVFILRDLEGLAVEEVSEVTQMDQGQIKSNLYYARLKIREGLTKQYRETKSISS
jgi:RNA polymerase sigma-70 factor (ECF subfamily)